MTYTASDGSRRSEPPAGDTPAVLPCPYCRYNLWGLDPRGKCPECGAPIRLAQATQPGDAAGQEVSSPVDEDLPCSRCGSNLRKRRIYQRCRDCAAPVLFSVPFTLLRESSPQWLRRVRSGLNMWIAMIIVGILMGIGITIQSIVLGVSTGGDQEKIMEASFLSGTLMGLAMSLLQLIAVIRITAPHPAIPVHGDPRAVRFVMRAGCVVALGSGLSMMTSLILDGPDVIMWVNSFIGLGAQVVTVGLFLYLLRFAARIPHFGLIRELSVLIWLYCGSMVLMHINGQLTMTIIDAEGGAWGTNPSPRMIVVGVISCFFSGVVLILTAWLLITLFRLRAAFTRVMSSSS